MTDFLDDPTVHFAPLSAAFEPNETLLTAAPITEGSHVITGTGIDWFEVTTLSGQMSFTMTPTDAVDLNMQLHNAAGQVIRTNFTNSGAESFTELAVADGTYYLNIYRAQFGDNPPAGIAVNYTLTIDLPEVTVPGPDDPGATLATATPIGQGSRQVNGTGIDWFRLDSLSGTIALTMTPAAGSADLNMELYNAAGQVVRTNFTNSGAETLSYLAPTDGVYYVKVYQAAFPNTPPNGTLLNYTLNVDLPELTVPGPNDPGATFATATAIGQGSRQVSGTMIDWFRLDSLSGTIALTMTPAAGSADLNMELYNAAGQVVQANVTNSGAETISYLAATDGAYYVKVYQAAFPNTPPNGTLLNYTLNVDLPEVTVPGPNDPGATLATATPIGQGSRQVSGTMIDWFRLDSLSGTIALTMTPAAGSPNLNMELYNAAGQVVQANVTDAAETISYLAATDGAYYVKVYQAAFPNTPPNGTLLNYTLNVDLPEAVVRGPADPGETRATATLIGPGTRAVSGTGTDWFRFETGPGLMSFRNAPTGDLAQPLDLALFDAAGNAVASAPAASGPESFSYIARDTATYYLRVSHTTYPQGTPNGIGMTYDLTVDLPEKTWSVLLPFGPVRNSSVAVYDIDSDGRDEIFVGTSKTLDAQGNEVRPAGLIVLEDDGRVKWTKTFAASGVPDPKTGKTYATTSVTTPPIFSDVTGDGRIDIVIGVGADNKAEFGSVGQPGDRGGVYALDGNGNTLWFFQTQDTFGDDGRPDGVYGAPVVFDIDGDGVREVMFTSWDHNLYVLDGRTGALERRADLHDTSGSTPAVADLNNDGLFELVVPSDITENPAGGITQQGGILHVFNNQLMQNLPGWKGQIGTSTDGDFRGKFDAQSLWSTAQIVDLNRDGRQEIVVGTGNFFQDGRGQYVKVWNADGTLRMQLDTNGRTLASVLIADLNGDGSPEIIAGTINGYVHAWSSNGAALFTTKLSPFGSDPNATVPIVRSPIAVDLDDDGKLEILVSAGAQLVVLDDDGSVMTSSTQPQLITLGYEGSPVARDIDHDGRLDLITGGQTANADQAVVYRFENPFDDISSDARTARYQENQSLHNIRDFVERFYTTILGRASDPGGNNDWTDRLYSGISAGADVARGFVFSQEFVRRGTSDAQFVNILYSAFFDRPADTGGFNTWMQQLAGGASRAAVLDGFIGSREFSNLASAFGIRAQDLAGPVSDAALISGTGRTEAEFLHGGAGASTLIDEGSSVFEAGPNEKDVYGQVFRLYGATLNRVPDPGGFVGWVDALQLGNLQLVQTAGAFVGSREFQNTYGNLNDTQFVTLLYNNVLKRAPDAGGLANWVGQLETARLEVTRLETALQTAVSQQEINQLQAALLEARSARAGVVVGFSESREFQNNTNPGLDNFMRTKNVLWNDVFEGGAGNDVMNGGTGSDTFIFRRGQGGSDVIHGFEPWDGLQLSGFGFRSGADARAAMRQDGADVVFNAQGQVIRFVAASLGDMGRVRYNVS